MNGDLLELNRKNRGLEPMGALSKTIPTIKVAFRPQERLLGEKVQNLITRLSKDGVQFKEGSFASVRTMGGFCHFPDLPTLLKVKGHQDLPSFTVIEYDPIRRAFIINGDGQGSLALEISWYCFRAFPDDVLVLGLPSSTKEGNDVTERDDDRIRNYLGMLKAWKGQSRTDFLGFSLLKAKNLDVDAENLIENEIKV